MLREETAPNIEEMGRHGVCTGNAQHIRQWIGLYERILSELQVSALRHMRQSPVDQWRRSRSCDRLTYGPRNLFRSCSRSSKYPTHLEPRSRPRSRSGDRRRSPARERHLARYRGMSRQRRSRSLTSYWSHTPQRRQEPILSQYTSRLSRVVCR